jgi:hypothetical protein
MDTDTEGMGRGTGRVHSYQAENSLILLALKLVLGIWLDCYEEACPMSIKAVTWTKLDKKVARDFKVRAGFVTELQKVHSNNGPHMIYHEGEKGGRGSKNHVPKLVLLGRQLIKVLHPMLTPSMQLVNV